MTTESISVDRFIPAPPERVWAAITQPEHVAQWWVPGNIEPTVGHTFLLEMPGWGNVSCEVLEVHEPDLFIYTFGDWTLTWRVIAEGHGSRLLLEHSGFDLSRPDHRFAFDNMGPGWRDEVLPRLSRLIDAQLDAEAPPMTSTGDPRLATARREADGWAVTFERNFAHPREKVWRAMTESEHLRHWFPCDIVGPRETGATIALPFWPAHVEKYNIPDPVVTGEIRVWDPPSVFEWKWSTDVLRWELEDTEAGTHLTFTARVGPEDAHAANTAAGYHVCIATLEQWLDEGSAPPLIDADVSPFEAAYRELIDAAASPD